MASFVRGHNRQLLFIGVSLVLAVCMPQIPLVPNVGTLFLMVAIIELMITILECGSFPWLIEMWPKNHPQFIFFVKTFYTLGLFIGPMLVAPYLEGDVTKFDPDLISLNKTTRDHINYSIDRRPKLIIPFIIASSIISISK